MPVSLAHLPCFSRQALRRGIMCAQLWSCGQTRATCYSNEPRPLSGMRRLIGPRSLTISFTPPGLLRVLGKVAAAGPGRRDNRVARSGQGVELRVEGRRYFAESSVAPFKSMACPDRQPQFPCLSIWTLPLPGSSEATCGSLFRRPKHKKMPRWLGTGVAWASDLEGRGWPDSSRM